MTYTAELFNGGLGSPQLARKKKAYEENKRDPRKCKCGSKLRTGNRAAGVCDRCREKDTQTTTVSKREESHYLFNLKAAREASGMSFPEVAEKANLQLPAVRTWAYHGESMQRAPLEAQRRLASVLGVTLEELRG